MSATFAALLSLASAVFVAAVGHFLAEKRSRRNELAGLRLKAYSDFLQAVSRLVAMRRLGKTGNELQDLAVLNDAKARICVCAEGPVVVALTKFWLSGGTLESESEILAFKRLCTTMRVSVGNRRKEIAMLRLSDTLFRLEPSSFSFRAASCQQKDAADEIPAVIHE